MPEIPAVWAGIWEGGASHRYLISEKKWSFSPYWRGSRQSEVPSSTVAFWQMFQMLKYMKTGREVKAVTPSQASMKMYVSMMNCGGNRGTQVTLGDWSNQRWMSLQSLLPHLLSVELGLLFCLRGIVDWGLRGCKLAGLIENIWPFWWKVIP